MGRKFIVAPLKSMSKYNGQLRGEKQAKFALKIGKFVTFSTNCRRTGKPHQRREVRKSDFSANCRFGTVKVLVHVADLQEEVSEIVQVFPFRKYGSLAQMRQVRLSGPGYSENMGPGLASLRASMLVPGWDRVSKHADTIGIPNDRCSAIPPTGILDTDVANGRKFLVRHPCLFCRDRTDRRVGHTILVGLRTGCSFPRDPLVASRLSPVFGRHGFVALMGRSRPRASGLPIASRRTEWKQVSVPASTVGTVDTSAVGATRV